MNGNKDNKIKTLERNVTKSRIIKINLPHVALPFLMTRHIWRKSSEGDKSETAKILYEGIQHFHNFTWCNGYCSTSFVSTDKKIVVPLVDFVAVEPTRI